MSKKAIHVVPGDGAWKVRTPGASKAAKITTTQAEAINRGRQMAERTKTVRIPINPDNDSKRIRTLIPIESGQTC
jgi:hypothetical protein